jgi:hypothetical protein
MQRQHRRQQALLPLSVPLMLLDRRRKQTLPFW